MKLNPPRPVRAALYLIGAVGVLFLQWATDEGWLDTPTRALIAGLLGLIGLLATANTVTTARRS